jgi:hypothetical protein
MRPLSSASSLLAKASGRPFEHNPSTSGNTTLRIEDLITPPLNFLQGEPEDRDYYCACQAAGMEEFEFGYFAVYRENEMITVAPYFVTDFRLNTLLPEGIFKKCLTSIRFRLACIGNPMVDVGRIHGEVSEEILSAIDRKLATKGSLLAYKGFGQHLPLPSYVSANGLPVPVLALRPDYYQAMKSKRRNMLGQKLKNAAALRYEESIGLPVHLVDRAYELYLNTFEKASLKFEKLTRDYFVTTSTLSHYLLFFLNDELIGFTQLICNGNRIINRYIGLDYAKSHNYGLYFAMFLRAIEFGIREGYTELELGPTSYAFKRLLGATQFPTWNYYRHTSPWINWVLLRLRRLLEPSEMELR